MSKPWRTDTRRTYPHPRSSKRRRARGTRGPRARPRYRRPRRSPPGSTPVLAEASSPQARSPSTAVACLRTWTRAGRGRQAQAHLGRTHSRFYRPSAPPIATALRPRIRSSPRARPPSNPDSCRVHTHRVLPSPSRKRRLSSSRAPQLRFSGCTSS